MLFKIFADLHGKSPKRPEPDNGVDPVVYLIVAVIVVVIIIVGALVAMKIFDKRAKKKNKK